ncbi:MAG: AmmeMemoRadiSam system protein A [Bacteroidales bacterium]|nr:AmmeMemoRadiSam system protein A [Bacteroidales bacterium]
MYKPESIYTKIALQTIISHIMEGEVTEIPDNEIPSELKAKKSCFVTLHNIDGELRGCVGTLTPYMNNLYEEIIQNSISAATKDSRFEAVSEKELDDICLSVSVLSEPYPIDSFTELDPKKKGLIVKLQGKTQAVLLPNIKGIDTVEDQIYKLKKKGGIEDVDNELLEFYAFTAKEYK